MSGEHSFSQVKSSSIRCLTELTFQVAMRMNIISRFLVRRKLDIGRTLSSERF
jgi:hypothetical protein